MQTHYCALVSSRHCYYVTVDRAGKNAAVVMVGVISGYFASAGNGKYRYIPLAAVKKNELVNRRSDSLCLSFRVRINVFIILKCAL